MDDVCCSAVDLARDPADHRVCGGYFEWSQHLKPGVVPAVHVIDHRLCQQLAEIVVIGSSPLERVLVVLRLLERYPCLAEAAGHQQLLDKRWHFLGLGHRGCCM